MDLYHHLVQLFLYSWVWQTEQAIGDGQKKNIRKKCSEGKNVQKNKSSSNYHEESEEKGKWQGKCISESDIEGKIISMKRWIHCTLEGRIGKDKELDLVVGILGRSGLWWEDEEIAGNWGKEE